MKSTIKEAAVKIKPFRSQSDLSYLIEITTLLFDPELTDRQREAVTAAVEAGYYAVPRESDVETVADSLDCAASTAAEHLRKAEQAMMVEFCNLQHQH